MRWLTPMERAYDAVVIGAGPNGLAAAIVLAQAGRSVVVFEAEPEPGGGARSAELTLPGFIHDLCSAVHPLAFASPFFRALPLADFGLEWIEPPAPVAHPLEDGSAVVLERSLDATAAALGGDGEAYRKLFAPLTRNWDRLLPDFLSPPRFPNHPVAMSAFGVRALRSARALAEKHFRGAKARALFAGLAAHSMLPLENSLSAGFGLVLGAAGHAVGWPVPRGGAQKIADALAAHLRSLGGEIVTGRRIESLDELPESRAVLCDVTPRQLLKIAGKTLPDDFRARLARYRYGMGVFKVDWALGAPIPWRSEACRRAGTVHIGGTLEEIADSERAAWEGRSCACPFVLLAQPSLFDAARAPAGKHTVWTYCHVPHGSTEDMTDKIAAQIERFAPGFGARVLARHSHAPADLERRNANLVGGDINGGAATLRQFFLRPTARLYATPVKGLYLCSASTPPGGGVHGMCGYFAAKRTLKECF
ncbi:MAG TPA: NAD(P)/FAD-dependent oxidoreductase [Verrucomicrobiae bacterium]|nr:NAD(P)/FAD-dependent oxidoreductase [Verrucomicrobiae bacterium]